MPAISEAALAVLAGGTLHVFDGHLRAGQLRPLRSAALELAAWGAMYETRRAAAPAARATRRSRRPPAIVPVTPLPRGRHGLPPGFVRRHQRARILDAVLQVSAEHGFEATSVRELITAAGLSTEAFYSHFASKEDAWAAAFDQAFVELFAAAWHAALAAARPDRRRSTAAVDAALTHLAAEPERARLLLVDAPRPAAPASPRSTRRSRPSRRLVARRDRGIRAAQDRCRPRWSAASPSWSPAGCSTGRARAAARAAARRWSRSS